MQLDIKLMKLTKMYAIAYILAPQNKNGHPSLDE
jgi:hypothetical protein